MPESSPLHITAKHILVLEAYDGGSHGQFLDGLILHSKQKYTRISMKPRSWKWRMRGSALWFIDEIHRQIKTGKLNPNKVDIIFTSDMTPVCDLKALLPESLKHCPVILFFHENQLTYPVQNELERDCQFGFTNITSALAANKIWFNSRYNLDSFANETDLLIKRMPDHLPKNIGERIRKNSIVMPLGLDIPKTYTTLNNRKNNHSTPPTIVWNHRWEHDKNPELFFETLFTLKKQGLDFKLIILGESFKNCPPIFELAQKILKNNITHCGYASSRNAYYQLLTESDIVISTALHEFFGISVLEAITCGATPLLPYRLSYPELIPNTHHDKYFYHSDEQFLQMLTDLLTKKRHHLPSDIHKMTLQLHWTHLAKTYDTAFCSMGIGKAHQCAPKT